jgi:cytochrome c-type biogenesis protein CcmH/NrfF
MIDCCCFEQPQLIRRTMLWSLCLLLVLLLTRVLVVYLHSRKREGYQSTLFGRPQPDR